MNHVIVRAAVAATLVCGCSHAEDATPGASTEPPSAGAEPVAAANVQEKGSDGTAQETAHETAAKPAEGSEAKDETTDADPEADKAPPSPYTRFQSAESALAEAREALRALGDDASDAEEERAMARRDAAYAEALGAWAAYFFQSCPKTPSKDAWQKAYPTFAQRQAELVRLTTRMADARAVRDAAEDDAARGRATKAFEQLFDRQGEAAQRAADAHDRLLDLAADMAHHPCEAAFEQDLIDPPAP